LLPARENKNYLLLMFVIKIPVLAPTESATAAIDKDINGRLFFVVLRV